jgi:LuxR family transcriptional regulator, maltose regulon positive regulatory protein
MGILNLVGVSPHVLTIMTHPGSDEKQVPCLLASALVYFLGGLGGTAAPFGRTQTQEGSMPRVPLHTLIWSQDQGCYALYRQDRLVQQLQPGDEAAWLAWLREVSSFAFHGASGSLNVYLEARSPGGLYWYAYHTKEGRTRKRYLGRTETLRLSQLEETARGLGPKPEVAQAHDQGMTLLSSRLVPPRRPAALVERERLLICLDGALSTPLTLVCAPAGYGKTTLLLDWASRRKSQVAWLSLEELDNTPTRFWVALIAALRRGPWGAAHLGETAVALLQSPQLSPLSSLLTALLHELESCEGSPAPLVLILDDYQVIEEQAIHEGLTCICSSPAGSTQISRFRDGAPVGS